MHFELLATCPEETKTVLVEEIAALGAREIKPVYKAVRFEVTEQDFYRAHLCLRTASSLYWSIATLKAYDENSLRQRAQAVDWPEFFGADKSLIVEGIPAQKGRRFMTGNEISRGVRVGIEQSFARAGIRHPQVNLKDPDVVVSAYMLKGRCLVSLKTSGQALHKRGYRQPGHEAPLKETLAASILMLAGYDGTQPLLDPMCGSGTLAIEAAMISLNKAPLIHRKKGEFGFEALNIFNSELWRKICDELRQKKSSELKAPIFANDISAQAVEEARSNALRARVERYLQFSVKNFAELSKSAESGLIVCNLPYGERLNKDNAEMLRTLYSDFGRWLKFGFPGWRAAVLTAQQSPYKHLGLRPERKIDLLNGSIPAKLLIFDLYAGKR